MSDWDDFPMTDLHGQEREALREWELRVCPDCGNHLTAFSLCEHQKGGDGPTGIDFDKFTSVRVLEAEPIEREMERLRATLAAREEPRRTHGRHCPCSACAQEDWTNPNLAPCGMHGLSCPAVYDPYPKIAAREEPSACSMCGGLGWVLDCNDLGKPGPRMVEMLTCLLPDCANSGQPIQSVNFPSSRFRSVARHPSEGFVMSVSGPVEA